MVEPSSHERAITEEALRDALTAAEAARADAERTNLLLQEFFTRASHELRGPLAAMSLWLDALRDECPIQRGRALEAMELSVQRQSRLVADLLDMARGLSGKLFIVREPMNLTHTVRAALERAAPEAPSIALTFVAPTHDIWVKGDRARLQQAVGNLISNACKFSHSGGRVEVRLGCDGERALISVQDQGRGISPSFLPHVFAPFHQEDTSLTRACGGLGLGLAIVKQIVELHEGKVGAASGGEDRGAMFTITLARIEAHAVDALSSDTAHRACSVKDLRVLVVDDDELVREGLACTLGHRVATVTAAASAREAMEALSATRFDVVVCDLAMPDEDGYSLLRRIRTLPASAGGQTPAIALSGQARAEDCADALAAGFQAHVAKPVVPCELIAILARAVTQPPQDE